MFDQFSPVGGATFFFLLFEINYFNVLSSIVSNIKIKILLIHQELQMLDAPSYLLVCFIRTQPVINLFSFTYLFIFSHVKTLGFILSRKTLAKL